MKIDTKTLAGTIILATLVVVFDYTMKYSSLKIPFPWYPVLKFDFTGIPIALSLYLFGFIPGTITSMIAFFAILARSGDIVSASMKALAEFSTVVGIAIALKVFPKFKRPVSFAFGIVMRCLVMFFANLVVLPNVYQMPFEVALGLSPLIAVFNIIQGSVSIFGGYFIFEAIKRRVPSLVQKKNRL